MDSILFSLLPKCRIQYTRNKAHPLFFDSLFIRPFSDSLCGKATNLQVSFENGIPKITAEYANVFYKLKCILRQVVYIIHKEISIRECIIKIGSLTITFHDIKVLFQESIQITIHEIKISDCITIKRFDRIEPLLINLGKNNNGIMIRIPEIRLYRTPTISNMLQWKQDIQRILPTEESDEPLPKVHVSSIFVRHVPTGWFRCISPISIGFTYNTIWELWEHCVRAITRI